MRASQAEDADLARTENLFGQFGERPAIGKPIGEQLRRWAESRYAAVWLRSLSSQRLRLAGFCLIETFHILSHYVESETMERGKRSMNARQLRAAKSNVKWKVKAKPYGGKRQALTQDELDRLFAALKGNRHGHRDYMMALVTFLHGLRVSELIDLRWDDIDWRKGTIAIRRLKGSIDGTHYLERDEATGLKRLQREQEPKRPHIFTSERGEAFTRFAINKMIATAGQNAKITWPVHPHCLRHTTGTMQANGGMDAWRLSKLMGHASIANTTKYVRMSPEPLKDAWRGKR